MDGPVCRPLGQTVCLQSGAVSQKQSSLYTGVCIYVYACVCLCVELITDSEQN